MINDTATHKTKMTQVGTEWVVDATGCTAELLRNAEILQALFAQIIADLRLHPLGTAQWERFPFPGGITGMVLLRESHLTCHTYPEYQTATFNLYCCQPRPTWSWEIALRTTLGATNVKVCVIERGINATN